jgi:hypothetical protein
MAIINNRVQYCHCCNHPLSNIALLQKALDRSNIVPPGSIPIGKNVVLEEESLGVESEPQHI